MFIANYAIWTRAEARINSLNKNIKVLVATKEKNCKTPNQKQHPGFAKKQNVNEYVLRKDA